MFSSYVNVAEFANVQLPENIIQTTDGSMFTYGGALARPGGSENGDCGCDGSDSEGSGDGGHDPVIASCAGTFTITGNGSAIVRVDGNMSIASSQLSTRGNLPVGHTFSYDFGETGQNYNACVVAIATAADQAMNGQPTCGNANSVTIPNLFGRSTVSLPYFQQCQAASSQQSITTPRRVTTAVAAAPVIPHKNVVMVVADMVENSDAMNVSTTFCDGNDPYNGQSVVGTYSADSFDEFYQGREGVRERYGLKPT
jgi:hypothetical protein